MRTWGDCYGYMLVATGRADIMVDEVISDWDCAAFMPMSVPAARPRKLVVAAQTVKAGKQVGAGTRIGIRLKAVRK